MGWRSIPDWLSDTSVKKVDEKAWNNSVHREKSRRESVKQLSTSWESRRESVKQLSTSWKPRRKNVKQLSISWKRTWKKLSTTPLNSVNHGLTRPRPCIDTRHVRSCCRSCWILHSCSGWKEAGENPGFCETWGVILSDRRRDFVRHEMWFCETRDVILRDFRRDFVRRDKRDFLRRFCETWEAILREMRRNFVRHETNKTGKEVR